MFMVCVCVGVRLCLCWVVQLSSRLRQQTVKLVSKYCSQIVVMYLNPAHPLAISAFSHLKAN